MPDYFPLFNASGKRVFDASGKPVFARVRDGSLSVPVSVYCWCAAREVVPGPYAPAGSIVISNTFYLTRTDYRTFTAYQNFTWSAWQYIGTDGSGKEWYIRGRINDVWVSWSSGFTLGINAAVNRGYKSGSSVTGWDVYAPTCWPSMAKSADAYIPEGSYTTSTPALTASNGYLGLTLSVPVSASFIEA